MPPKPVPAQTIEAPAGPTAAQQQQEATDADKLALLLEQLGADVAGGFTAYMERLPRPGTPADMVGYLGPTEFSSSLLDDTAGTDGGGKFRARIHDARGKYKTSFTFTVAGAPKRRDVGSSAAASGGAPSAEPGSSRLERLIEGLAASIAGVVELVKAQQQPKGHSLGEVIEIAKTLKELAPAPQPASSAKEMLETIEAVMDIRERLGGGESSDVGAAIVNGVQPLVGLGQRYLTLQEKALDMRARGQLPPRSATASRSAAAGAGAPQGGSAAAPPAAAPAAAVAAGEVDLVLELARSIPKFARNFLRGHAAADSDPQTYAAMALDTIRASNADTYELLPQLVALPDFADRMLQHVAEWAPHRDWFVHMFDEMKAQLEEELADVGEDESDERPAATPEPAPVQEKVA